MVSSMTLAVGYNIILNSESYMNMCILKLYKRLLCQNSELTKTSVRVILRNSCISVKGHFAELTVIPDCVVFAIITNSISFSFIICAAIGMIVTLTCCNIKDK